MNLRFFRIFNIFGTYIRLFRIFGINVYMNESWLIALPILIQFNSQGYFSRYWYGVEFLALIVLVLLHEFGHALACTAVGGIANRIILWPLGGQAHVTPPPRPGLLLFSIATGPMVNVLLLPLLNFVLVFVQSHGGAADGLAKFVERVVWINTGLLIFNLFPIYPLDGGKILWSLLWLFMDRWRSLMVAAYLGLGWAAALLVWAIFRSNPNPWLLYLAMYCVFLAWSGFNEARKMVHLNCGPKHQDFICPSCGEHPPHAALCRCNCGATFDIFTTHGFCPTCNAVLAHPSCYNCGTRHPILEWKEPVPEVNGMLPSPMSVSHSS